MIVRLQKLDKPSKQFKCVWFAVFLNILLLLYNSILNSFREQFSGEKIKYFSRCKIAF